MMSVLICYRMTLFFALHYHYLVVILIRISMSYVDTLKSSMSHINNSDMEFKQLTPIFSLPLLQVDHIDLKVCLWILVVRHGGRQFSCKVFDAHSSTINLVPIPLTFPTVPIHIRSYYATAD